MVYGDFEDVATRTASDKVLRDKAFHIAKCPKYDRYQRGLAINHKVYQLFDKKVSSSGNKSMPSQQLADELHKQILKKTF